MRALIQRVTEARVRVDNEIKGEIGTGLLVFLGVEDADEVQDLEWLSKKIIGLRIFSDNNGKMNLDLRNVEGAVLCVSQFTLHASTKKGNRPSFIRSADPTKAEKMYLQFIDALRFDGMKVAEGVFGANMQVELVNDGPVTIWIDSKNKE